MKIKFMVLSAVIVPLISYAVEPLTLSKALELVDSSPRNSALRAEVRSAEGRLLSSSGAFMPQVNVSERYVRTDDPVGVFAGKLQQGKFTAQDMAINNLNHPDAINNWVTRAEITQPVLHSTTDLYKRGAASHQLNSVRQMSGFERESLRLDVVSLYYQAVAYREKAKVLKGAISSMKALEASYEQASAPSSANETNYIVAKSIRSDLESQLVSVETMGDNTKRYLASILGIKDPEGIELTDSIPEAQRSINEEWSGSETRGDVKAAESMYRAAVSEHRSAKSTFGPNVDLFAAYNRYTGDFKSSDGSYEAGMLFSWPIFSGERFGKVKEANANRMAARESFEAMKLKAEAEKENSAQRLNACIEQYRLNKRATDEAAKALRLAKQRYMEGTLPLLDYSQTIQNWAMISLRLVDSRYSVAESDANKKFQTGDL